MHNASTHQRPHNTTNTYGDFEYDYYYDFTDEYFDVCPDFYLSTLYTYYIPIVIGVGLVGNLLALIVFTTTHLKMRSSSYYLAALAVTDFGFVSVLLVVHCSFNNFIKLYQMEGWCQLLVYISSVCSTLSAWLIVAFTVERFIAVQYPLKRAHMCTVSRAKTTVFALATVAMVSHMYIYWAAGIVQYRNVEDQCEMIPETLPLMKVINYIDTGVTLMGPIILIVVLNTMIARNIFLFRKRMENGNFSDASLESASDSSQQISSSRISKQSLSAKSSGLKGSRKTISSHTEHCMCINVQPTIGGRVNITRRNQQSVTKMLLLISSVFVIFNLPSYICRIYVFVSNLIGTSEKPPTMLWCIQQLSMLLFYTNYSINFLLYSMCGMTFRRCMLQLLRNKLKLLTKRPCQK